MRSRWPIHPFLLAVFPILFVYTKNASSIPRHDALRPIVVAVALAALLLVAARLVLGNAGRAALLVSVVVVYLSFYGHLHDVLLGNEFGKFVWGRHLVLLPIWTVVAGLLVWLALRARRLSDANRVLNIVSIALILTLVVPMLWPRGRAIAAPALATQARLRAMSGRQMWPHRVRLDADRPKRDIYYIILDRYPGQGTTRDRYRIDNSAFFNGLRSRGFHVADSWANYPRTTHSLASSLNMQYLDFLEERYGRDNTDKTPLFALLQGSAVARSLQAIGYKYIEVGSWWRHTARDPRADVRLAASTFTEFERVLYTSSVLGALGETAVPSMDIRRQYWRITRRQFQLVESTNGMAGPKFVFAHILLPHSPWVFRKNGSYRPKLEAVQRPGDDNFLDQVQYANRRVTQMVDRLLERPARSQPIIVLQSDEGPFPRRFGREGGAFRWDQASSAELQVKMNILNAYYLPGVRKTHLYTTITPVNSFRLIFERYFGAHIGLLPDRIWAYEDTYHPYAFHDVTWKSPPYTAASNERTDD